jgi:hypothetical protein
VSLKKNSVWVGCWGRGGYFDGLDDVDQVDWQDFVIREGQCHEMNRFG